MSNNVTVKDLRQIAGALGVPGRSKMNKGELVQAIQQHQRSQRGGAAVGAPFYTQLGGAAVGAPFFATTFGK